jgi:hypothetical protein
MSERKYVGCGPYNVFEDGVNGPLKAGQEEHHILGTHKRIAIHGFLKHNEE